MGRIDEQCSMLKQAILNMARRVSSMIELSLEAMAEQDANKALKVIKMDEFVNCAEEDINNIAIEGIALLSPVATDLRVLIAGIKIASDLERIGDYAKNIATYVIEKGMFDEEIIVKAREMGDVFLTMLDHAMDAYNREDVKWAMTIPEEDEKINEKFREIIQLLEARSEESVRLLIPTIGVIRNLERAGDHTKNICEHCIFQIKGMHIEFN